MMLFIGIVIGVLAYPFYLFMRTLWRDVKELWKYLDAIEEEPDRLTLLGRCMLKIVRILKGKKL